MQLPSPDWKNISLMHHILTSNIRHKFMLLEYIQPVLTGSGYFVWQVIYKCVMDQKPPEILLFLETIQNRFKKCFSCSYIRSSYNLKDRVTLIIGNDDTICVGKEDRSSPSIKKNPQNKRFGIGFIPSSKITLDQEVKEENPIQKYDRKSRSRKNSNLVRYLEVSKRLKTSNCILDEQKKDPIPFETIKEISDTKKDIVAISTVSSIENIQQCEIENNQDKKIVQVSETTQEGGLDTSMCNKSKEKEDHSLTHTAVLAKTSRRYALSKLNDIRVYDMARLYVSYLGFEKPDIIYNGETKISLGMKLQSEGFILKELGEIWFEFGKLRGLSHYDIKCDLDTYKDHCRSNRLTRLQQASNTSRAWLGLRGGNPTIPVNHQNLVGKRDVIKLDDVILSNFS